MHDIEREAMDIQLQDKLLSYKQDMGLLGEGSSNDTKQISAGEEASDESSSDEKSDEKSTEQLLAEAEEMLKDKS